MKRPFPLFAAVLLAAIVATACKPKSGSGGGHSTELPVATVRVQTVESKSRPITEEVVGTVRARWRARLEARLSGRIETIAVVPGDNVGKGQLIARLDAAEIKARLDQAQAALIQSEQEWKRIAALFEDRTATRSEYDMAQARLAIARGTAAEAAAMMSYVEITAPFAAVVTRKWVEAGDFAAPGKPLVDIEDPTILQIEADVPEAIASHIQRNSRLAIHADALGKELSGIVSETTPSADPVSRTFRVKLDLPETGGAKPGQFVRLAVPIGESKAVRVAASAIVQRGQLEIVFVVASQHAQLHLVKTGKRVGDEIEILSGLNHGDRVVIEGAAQLTDGQPMEAK